ncbi:MAG: hypothetical protein NUV74_07955, partial [Candidatus Brocadiaceae bacterium]|nr:hypothetical protein [Candidatus Brocadiaceae bacterium]
FFHSPKQLEKHYPLAILAFFDFSFLNYILEENHNVSVSRTIPRFHEDKYCRCLCSSQPYGYLRSLERYFINMRLLYLYQFHLISPSQGDIKKIIYR